MQTELLERVRSQGTRFVDFWFTDLSGRAWRITVKAETLSAKFLDTGIILDGATIGPAWEGFITLRPDAAAGFLDTTATSAQTLALFCDVDVEGGPHPLDGRRTLKRAEAYLIGSGLAAGCNVGAEPEFYLLKEGKPVAEEILREFLREMAATLMGMGMPIEWFRYGQGPGQGRVQMRSSPPIVTADNVMLYKHAARILALRQGLKAVFLPKPYAGPFSAAMHMHHSLWRDNQNLFHDPHGWAYTSEMARWYAGGILRHAPALLALCAPTTNSYRRLTPGSGVATELFLSNEPGGAVCRIPAGSSGPTPQARRVKFTCADSSANPYLAIAAMMMAGIDGVENKIEPATTAGDAKGELPYSLEDSLRALQNDNAFLTKAGVFAEDLITAHITNTLNNRVLPIRNAPHPLELELE